MTEKFGAVPDHTNSNPMFESYRAHEQEMQRRTALLLHFTVQRLHCTLIVMVLPTRRQFNHVESETSNRVSRISEPGVASHKVA